MAYKTAFNGTPGPVVADDEGRIIGGGEWGTVDTTSDEGGAALDRGDLRVVEVGEDANDQAVAAAANTARMTELSKTPKDDLADQAEALGVEDADELPKDELVQKVASGGRAKPKTEA